MLGVAVVGAQWGDEGKGKAVDALAAEADYVVRCQGGSNAGHTLRAGGRDLVLHLIPSGILHPHVVCVIAAGAALDVEAVCGEIAALKSLGFLKSEKQLKISDSSTLLLPHHKAIDQAREARAGSGKIGTTGKGVGPAYESRAGRTALLFGDLFGDKASLLKKIQASLREKNFLLEKLYSQKPFDPEELLSDLLERRETLRPFRFSRGPLKIRQALQEGKKVIFEGAQGSLLDLFHGTYPYVTSSSTLTGGMLAGAGLGPEAIGKTTGIAKAYTTRVGFGPFPTEAGGSEEGAYIQAKGREFGATTGRRRRCGWLDLVALKYAVRLSGINSLALMKLDVLTGLKELKICEAYEIGGRVLKEFPAFCPRWESVRPRYRALSGWTEPLGSARKKRDLPRQALEYAEFISSALGIPLEMISAGPSREETIRLRPLFA